MGRPIGVAKTRPALFHDGPAGELLLVLAPAVFCQRTERTQCQVPNAPAAGCLGLYEEVAQAGLSPEGPVHGQSPGREVDIAPQQPYGLTDAEPGRSQEHPEGVEAIAVAIFE